MKTALLWLPVPDTRPVAATLLRALAEDPWANAVRFANNRLDFVRTNQLDAALQCVAGPEWLRSLAGSSVRLAIMSSCTTAQLHPAIRVAGMRRNIALDIFESSYGQYWQELSEPSDELRAFKPTVILLALDSYHLAAGVNVAMSRLEADAALEEVKERIRTCWRLAKDAFGCQVIHQTALPVHPSLIGSNEHRLAGSKADFIVRLGAAVREMADAAGVDLLAVDDRAARDGIAAWHDVGLWHRAKQEISPAAAPLYGDLLARLFAAKLGRSYKCLVLDLDNTLWGGVIGDDGLDGIVIGQGSALGEAYVAFQEYVRELGRRGVILAVCSKNSEANALEPFDEHPDMVLKRADIASFVANWSDKAANIRAIAADLNIGLDSLVFVDDNPFERALVRQELPMVAVPEVGDDPKLFAQIVSDAGYFESLVITKEDRERGGQYQGNRMREALKASTTDLPSYLRSLDMTLMVRAFDKVGLARIVQLINKTNQFNLTTRRYTEHDVAAIMDDERAFGLQLRLTDRFGDNGIISIVIGKMQGDDLLLDTWLMSCRVLGRQVEATTLNLVIDRARRLGARRVIGEYISTKKNGMVRNHYVDLGFDLLSETEEGSLAALHLSTQQPAPTFIRVEET